MNDYTLQDLKDAADALGWKLNVVKVGQGWMRVFLIDPRGCSLGRAMFRHDVYSHTKLYLENTNHPQIMDYDYSMASWWVALQWKRVLMPNEWTMWCAEAKRKQQAEYNAKVLRRAENPHPKGKRRRALQRRNLRSYIHELIASNGHITPLKLDCVK